MDDFIGVYNDVAGDIGEPQAHMGSGCQLLETVIQVIQQQEHPSALKQEAIPIRAGGVALLHGNIGWFVISPNTGRQVFLRTQLLPLSEFADSVEIASKIIDPDLRDFRRK
jgi:hypothetical protein